MLIRRKEKRLLLELYRRLGINLDLALEANEVVRGKVEREIPGVTEEKETYPFTQITTVKVLNALGEKATGKAQGTYITLESQALSQNHPEAHAEISNLCKTKLLFLAQLFGLRAEDTVLVVGLGNWGATPDALGPRTAALTIVTRQLHQYAPAAVPPGWRPTCSFTPGVLGTTGVETAEMIKGVTAQIKPALVLAVDALAAKNVNRLGTTIQMANTGISPGSGIGNQRQGITWQTIGAPVIALGVPTVVPAAVIALEAIQQMGLDCSPRALEVQVQKLLTPFGGSLTVTPKEIDTLITRVARILASGINQFLFPTASFAEINALSMD